MTTKGEQGEQGMTESKTAPSIATVAAKLTNVPLRSKTPMLDAISNEQIPTTTPPLQIRSLLVGESKTGKTTSTLTLPGKKFYIALTTRTRPVVQHRLGPSGDCILYEIFEEEPKAKESKYGDRIYKVNAKAFDKLWALVSELWVVARQCKASGEAFPYSGVILDDLSALDVITMNHILGMRKHDGTEVETGPGGVQAEIHYQPHNRCIRMLVYSFLLQLPCHIVVLGHTRVYEDKQKIVERLPKIMGSVRTEIASWFDEVYECANRTVKDDVHFFWRYQNKNYTKFLGSTINTNNSLWTGDFQVDLSEKPSGFEKIIALASSKKPR
jgi:hypothetical protein